MGDAFRVTIVKATGLLGNDGFGANKTSDPFVEVSFLNSSLEVVKGESKRTRDVSKTINPIWNEVFTIGIEMDLRMATFIAFTIFDKNLLKNVPLGRVVVAIQEIRDGVAANGVFQQKYSVEKFGKMKVATGELYLEFVTHQKGFVSGDAVDINVVPSAAPGSEGLEHTGPPNLLHVTIESATGLPAMDRGGTSDPLVIITCNKTKLNTTTKTKTLSCMWNESFRFPVINPKEEVLFTVEDFDITVNDFMGQAKVSLESLADGKAQTLTLDLLDKKFRKRDGLGTLTVTLRWHFSHSIDEVVAANKKKAGGIFSKVTNALVGNPDAGDDDEEGIDADAVEEDGPKKSEEELKKEAEEKEKAMAEERKALEDIDIKSGDYSVQVHIIEARDLVGKDATGTSDPVVYVDVMGEEQHTSAKSKTLSAVWDEVLIFTFRNLDKDDVEAGFIKLSVMDANTLARAELIGDVQFDVSFIYSHMNHQICNKWLGLTAPGQDGIQGYLRVSITIVGPGDKFVTPPPIGPDNSGLDAVMMPSSVKQDVVFLVCKIHVGEHLPPMDSLLGGLKQGLDAYVQCSLGSGKPTRTRVKTKSGERHTLNPAFNDELWLVMREPSMANQIVLCVKDWDKIGKDEVVAHSYQSLRLIKKLGGSMGPMWINLYGAPISHAKGNVLSSDSVKEQMNTYPDMATFYRGRILVTFEIRDNDKNLDEVNQRVKATPLHKHLYPETAVYRIRAYVGLGSDIPQITSLTSGATRKSKMQILITCGLHELNFERKENHKGNVVWNQLMETDNLVLPKDPDQIPDIFVYLCKGKADGKLSTRKQVAYKRYSAKKLLKQGMTRDPVWVTLQEDPAVDALKDEVFPGNVFLNLGFGTEETAHSTRSLWQSKCNPEILNTRHKYQVQVNIFQGRQLPALDDNGLCDPYIKVRFCGEEKKLDVKKKTRDPLWYQTIVFDADLPPENYLQYSPQILLRAMDWDMSLGVGSDAGHDYMGTSFLSITADNVRTVDDPRPPPVPQWHGLMQQEVGDTEGSILASVVVIKKDHPDMVLPPPPSIAPKMVKAYLEIIVLGLRDMKPYQFLPIQLPFVEFTLGGKAHANQEMKTEKSKRPSGSNPNFLQRIVREVELPEVSLFAPMLNVMVRDTRLGGWIKPTVGNCSIDMTTRLPWGEGYIPPQAPNLDCVVEQEGDEEDEITEEAPLLQEQVPTGKVDVGAGVFGALTAMNISIDLENPSLLTDTVITDMSLSPTAGQDPIDEEDGIDEFEIKRKKYMKNRVNLDEDLEASVLTTKPFETYKLTIGNNKKKKSLMDLLNPAELLKFGSKKKLAISAEGDSGTFHVSGIFKGLIRVMRREDDPPLINLDKLLNPQPYTVRIYVLNGEAFAPMDPGVDGHPGKSDPYLILRLGKEKINDRKNYIDDVVDPDFYKLFEFHCHFPGASMLHVDAYDHDFIGGDDLIGSTKIDLEDRFFDKNWQALGHEFQTTERWGPKPVEQRTLFVPTSRAPMGQLKLWVDILTPKEAANFPPVDIALPPPREFELRVAIWKTKEVPNFDELTEMNDLFVRCQLEGSDHQDTDIHWRAKKGKASFNWRMKFPVVLGHKQHNSKFPYFKLQMWDKDIFSSNDCIAEGIIDMQPHFQKVCKLQAPYQVYQDKTPRKKESASEAENNDAIRSIKEATGLWDTDPTDSTWIKMERFNRETNVKEPMGAVCISMELMPKEKAKVQTVGFGRSDPNNSPFLPPPAGRLKFSMNPFYVFNELLGPRICRRVMCVLVFIACGVFMYFAGPIVNLLIVLLK
ncbi:hypothetical protein THRCLA_05475 [Thraustotheca clavata]|uniref:C2 domain-containing protein n=1 Tax=Thraustotheca clavata TaxID=74557 RepID=A0A1V9ZWG6_9STRA|nr:hypothetical protein THRCLA_05475 [Thraustotheca clavata]